MRLDVISDSTVRATVDVVPLYLRARAEFCALGLEPETLDLGTAICCPPLARLHDTNRVVDARVPAGIRAETLWEEVVRHFDARGAVCFKCTFSAAATDAEKQPLLALLQSRGWFEHRLDVWRLDHAAMRVDSAVRVVSARAVFRQYEQFAKAAAAEVEPQLADAAMLRLDDPRWDAMVAIVEGQVVARAGVLSLGEVGLIENVSVLPSHRRRGYGKAVMEHAIELCARSQFRHVLLGCDSDNQPAQALYASLGFVKAGQSSSWCAPSVRAG